MLSFAITRVDIGNYVDALFLVYIAIIFVYLLLNMIFSLGVRKPYWRALDGFMAFLRDVSEPYLRLFRRIIPPMGMVDFSPIAALLVLYVLRLVIVGAIQGTL